MKTEPTEKEIEAESVATHLAELVLTGALSEEEHDALAATWKLRN